MVIMDYHTMEQLEIGNLHFINARANQTNDLVNIKNIIDKHSYGKNSYGVNWYPSLNIDMMHNNEVGGYSSSGANGTLLCGRF